METPACCNAPNTKTAALPNINAARSAFMALNDTPASRYLFRHVTDIDHHKSYVVSLRTGAHVLGPPKHLIKQTLREPLSRKILVSHYKLAQLGLSERLASSIYCLHQPVREDQQAIARFQHEFCLPIFLAWPHAKQQSTFIQLEQGSRRPLPEQQWRMPRRGVAPHPLVLIKNDVHCCRVLPFHLTTECRVQPGDDLARLCSNIRVRRHRHFDHRGHQRCRHAMPSNIGHYDS